MSTILTKVNSHKQDRENSEMAMNLNGRSSLLRELLIFFIKTSFLSLVNGAAVQAMNGVEEQAVSTGKFEHFNP